MVADNLTALHAACHQGHRQIVAILLNAGAKIDVTNNTGNTALHFAAQGYVHMTVLSVKG